MQHKKQNKNAANAKYSTNSTCCCRARPRTRVGCICSVPQCNFFFLFNFLFFAWTLLARPSYPTPPSIPPLSLSRFFSSSRKCARSVQFGG